MKPEKSKYDVVVLGGGLAGLTLSMQIKQQRPETSILVLEKRSDTAPTAAHKVGESTVELGTHYLREVLGLKNYMDEFQLPKHGLRFYFTPQHKDDISKRVELGPKERLPVPSHQIDRGIFENDLIKMNRELGNEVILGASVEEVNLGDDIHQTRYEVDGESFLVDSSWVSDTTGRRGFLKRKLDFVKEMDHEVNAVWFRINKVIDVHEWSDDVEWKSKVEPGLRMLGTIHLMDTGYWVWLIPLVSGSTSVGIVADAKIHNFKEINKFDKAMNWLKEHEPLAFEKIDPLRDDLMDFMALKHFAHHSGRFYSADRWGVSGESGAFLDPFYSPGTDFISCGNTWMSDLIIRDLNGEDVDVRASIYEQMHNAFIENWLPIYQNKYQLMGNTQVMVVKIFWDWATYWGISTLLFTNKGITNISILKQLFSAKDSVLRKLGALNRRMQQLFLDWNDKDNETHLHHYLDPLDVGYLKEFHSAAEIMHSDENLVDQLRMNMDKLEKIAAELFRRISNKVNDTDPDMSVDPYQMDLNQLMHQTSDMSIGKDDSISRDVDTFWFHQTEKVSA